MLHYPWFFDICDLICKQFLFANRLPRICASPYIFRLEKYTHGNSIFVKNASYRWYNCWVDWTLNILNNRSETETAERSLLFDTFSQTAKLWSRILFCVNDANEFGMYKLNKSSMCFNVLSFSRITVGYDIDFVCDTLVYLFHLSRFWVLSVKKVIDSILNRYFIGIWLMWKLILRFATHANTYTMYWTSNEMYICVWYDRKTHITPLVQMW